MNRDADMREAATTILEDFGGREVPGHFQLASGNHSYTYRHVRIALAHNRCRLALAGMLLSKYREKDVDPTVILSWTIGGRILADAMMKHFAPDEVRHVIAEQSPAGIRIRGRVETGDVVFLVDDILTTGQTVSDIVHELEQRAAGALRAVGVVVRMSSSVPRLGVPFLELTHLPIPNWRREDCEKCQRGEPFNDFSDANVDPLVSLDGLSPDVFEVVIDEVARLEQREDLAGTLLGDNIAKVLRDVQTPLHEFEAGAPRRAAVIGTEGSRDWLRDVTDMVLESNFDFITAKALGAGAAIEKDNGGTRLIEHGSDETINEFARRIVANSSAVILVHQPDEGDQQLPYAMLCRDLNKPVLALVSFSRAWTVDTSSCPYLDAWAPDHSLGTRYCNGYKAVEEELDVRGGWICAQMHERCPFPRSGLSVQLLDLYNTRRDVRLIGSDRIADLKSVVGTFLAALDDGPVGSNGR